MLSRIVSVLDNVIKTGNADIYYDAEAFGSEDPAAAGVEAHQESLSRAHTLRHALREVEGATLYLYRVCELDGDGDPLDHGLARATDIEDLRTHLEGRFRHLGLEGSFLVRVYPVSETLQRGVLATQDLVDLAVEVR
jgi:hypothetical protein